MKKYLVSCDDTNKNRFFPDLSNARLYLLKQEAKGNAGVIHSKGFKVVQYGKLFTKLYR